MLSNTFILGEELIKEFLEAQREGLIAYMDSEDRNATGRSKASIQVVNATKTTGQLIGSQSIEYVFKGRTPGKMPPLSNIIDWCNARGLPRGVAWIVAKTIADSGTKLWQSRRNIFDEIITDEKINAFVNSIAVVYTARLRTEMNSLFNIAA